MMIIDGSNGITFPDTSKQYNSYYNFKNRIINGAMVIDQRNAGASVTINTSNPTYTLDRWGAGATENAKFTVQRNAGSVTPPAGFTNYLGVTSSSAYSVVAGDYFYVGQRIEGFNIADLNWGTANAQTVTLSFWVRSSLTGTFGGALVNDAYNRGYPFSYSISAANTWEQKSITIAGDTTGTWLTTNGLGIVITFGLGVGSTNSGTAGAWAAAGEISATGATSVVGTNGATFYITGVQLEKGTQATSFDYRAYGTELALCQRYGLRVDQQQNTGGVSSAAATTNTRFTFPVTMRAAPTASLITAGSWIVGNDFSANFTAASASITAQQLTPAGGRVSVGGFTFSSNAFVAGTDTAGTAVMFMNSEL
jgi:hypothetical protein